MNQAFRCPIIVIGRLFFSAMPLRAAPIDPNDILVSVQNSVREFTPTGTLVQSIPFTHDNRHYAATEELRGITVDQYGWIDSFNGTFNPYLTRYSPTSSTFTNKTYPGWYIANDIAYGHIAAYHNFVFVPDMGSFLGKVGGIIRFDCSNDSSVRFANDGTQFIAVNVGLDGKLYALVTTDFSANEIRVYDPVTTSLLNQMPLPSSITSNDYIFGIAVDQNGEMFLAGQRGIVYRVNSLGTVGLSANTGFNGVTNIQLDEKGRLALAVQNRVIVGDSLLVNGFISFQVTNDPNSIATPFVSFAHAIPPPPGPVPTPTPTPTPSPTAPPIHNILVSIGLPVAGEDIPYDAVREFGADGSFIRKVTFNYNGGTYPSSTEYLRDIVVDQDGMIDAFNGTFSPCLTRYSQSSDTFSHTTFPGWNIWNYTDFGGIAAYQNFIYVNDMDTAEQSNLNGIVRFDTSQGTAIRFAAGTDFITLNMGLDGKLYALFPGCGSWQNCSQATDINIYDPLSMQLIGHVAIPSDILSDDAIGAIAADQTGRIFLCGLNGIVYRLSSSGVYETATATGFSYPSNMKIDETGRIIVGEEEGWVSLGDTTLSNEFYFFQAINDPTGSVWTLFVAFSPVLPSPPPLQLVSAASRKTHGSAGTFGIDLPLSGTPGIECRSGGSNAEHYMVFTFTNPLVNVGSVNVLSGNASVYGTFGSDTHEYWVHLSGVANAQTVTVTLNNVTDNAGNAVNNVSAPMAVLLGDTTGNGLVNSSDIAQTQSQSGQPVTSSNFREDITVNGLINSSDVSLVQAQSGTGLSTSPQQKIRSKNAMGARYDR